MIRFTCCLFLTVAASATAVAQSRPNIIFFFTDDLGYGDVGCFWQDQRATAKKFDTPALDTMAAEGAKLTHHYVSASVCAPSRASLLQGRHQGHCDVRNSQFNKPLPDTHNMASVLKAAGYRTIHIGKAGLAGLETDTDLTGTGSQNLTAHPLDRGFDRFFGYLFHTDGHEHFPRNGTTTKDAHIYDDFQQVKNASLDLYTTDAWTAAAKKEIIDEATDGDQQPFFLYLAYDAPHFNLQRPAVAYPALDNDGNPLTGGIQWTTATDGAGRVRYATTADGTGTVDGYTHPDIPASWTAEEKRHVGMIRRIDDSVADIIQTLKDLGIDDNTLCVFSSDNGPTEEGTTTDGGIHNPRSFQSYANMEGTKRDLWEAGIRAPTIVRWPGDIAGATNDPNNIRTINYPSGLWDWMPTFCDVAGVHTPAWCDGVSLLPTLTGIGTQRDKGYLYFEYFHEEFTKNWAEFPNHRNSVRREMQALRIGNHMGVRTDISTGSEPFKIYDVTTDPGQATDLAGTLPDLAAEMQDLALTARRPGAGISRPYDHLALPAVSPSMTQANGVDWKSYTDAGATWQWVPEFRNLTPTASGTAANITLDMRPTDENFGLLYTGYIQIPTAGSYNFHVDADTGVDFFLHDGHLIANDINHSASVSSPSVNLEAGLHPFRLYYRHSTGSRTLSLEWSGPGLTRAPVPNSVLFAQTPASLTAVDDSAVTRIDAPVLVDVLANDYDDGLPAAISIQSVGTPDFGSAVVESGKIRYTPSSGFEDTATFDYTITDGEGSDTATVTVDVVAQQSPIAVDDKASTTGSLSGAGNPVTIPVLANDSDADRGPSPLSITSVGNPIGGSVSISGDDLLYTPAIHFIGTDAFTYTVSDGAATATARVVVEVNAPDPDDLTAYWNFEGDATDQVSGTAGTLVGSATTHGSALAPVGSASLNLPASGSYLNTNTRGGLGGTGSFTVLAFVNTTTTVNAGILSYSPTGGGVGGADLRLLIQGNGDLRIEMSQGAGFDLATAGALNDGNTHLIAAVFNSSTGNSFQDVDLYVDGTLYDVTSGTDHTINLATTGPGTTNVLIGRDQNNATSRPFVGLIDEVAVYRSALSLTELNTIEAEGVMPVLNLFSTWMSDPNFALKPEDRGFSGDPDGDGLENGLEAWFGTSPAASNAGLSNLAVLNGTTTSFTHPKNANPPEDLTGFYQWSTNLSDWYVGDGVNGPVSGPFVTITSSTVAGTTTVTATSSATVERLFLRTGVAQKN